MKTNNKLTKHQRQQLTELFKNVVVDANSSDEVFEVMDIMEKLADVIKGVKNLIKDEKFVRIQLGYKNDLILRTFLNLDIRKNKLGDIERYLDEFWQARALLDYQQQQYKDNFVGKYGMQ